MTVPTQQNSAMEQLIQQLGACVETALEPREGASYDGLKVSSLPDAVIRVQKDTQVGEVLKIANEFTIPVTTRGAGSFVLSTRSFLQKVLYDWGEHCL
jgi:FAD/FMN-containing dehydrogenase